LAKTHDFLWLLGVFFSNDREQQGDDERSFGVWRMQSGKRMYTAYHVPRMKAIGVNERGDGVFTDKNSVEPSKTAV
jgi:hypothetical protein